MTSYKDFHDEEAFSKLHPPTQKDLQEFAGSLGPGDNCVPYAITAQAILMSDPNVPDVIYELMEGTHPQENTWSHSFLRLPNFAGDNYILEPQVGILFKEENWENFYRLLFKLDSITSLRRM